MREYSDAINLPPVVGGFIHSFILKIFKIHSYTKNNAFQDRQQCICQDYLKPGEWNEFIIDRCQFYA
jgi:hypothetical protein